MRFLRTVPGAIATVVFAALAAGYAMAGWQVWEVLRPARGNPAANLGLDLAGAEAVRFPAADGLEIAAWYLPALEGSPAVVLVPDAGSGKASLLDLAIVLQQAGLHALVLDPRGHGESGGSVGTLGVEEKRDVLGAIDWLAGRRETGKRLGAFGVGTGAHAVVLAAADRPALGTLALDGLWPGPSRPLERRVFAGWRFGEKRLGIVARSWYAILTGSIAGGERAEEALHALRGRDVLLLASERDEERARFMREAYEALPQSKNAEGNLVVRPATFADGLAGPSREELQRYLEEYFRTRLLRG